MVVVTCHDSFRKGAFFTKNSTATHQNGNFGAVIENRIKLGGAGLVGYSIMLPLLLITSCARKGVNIGGSLAHRRFVLSSNIWDIIYIWLPLRHMKYCHIANTHNTRIKVIMDTEG